MKRIYLLYITMVLLCLGLSSATSYYVSNSGNDSSSTGNITNPYKTISKLNSLSVRAGDTIYFNRGDIWRLPNDAYPVFASGNSSSRITITTYGVGANPVFLGSINCSNNWTSLGSNIYVSNWTSETSIGNIILNNSFAGVRAYSYANLTEQGRWYFNSTTNKTYIYSTSEPSSAYSSMECAVSKNLFFGSGDSADYINLYNLTLLYGGRHGVGESGNSFITIDGLNVSWMGGQISSGTTRLGNCIQFGLDTTNTIVRNSYISECWDAGITHQSWTTSDAITNSVIENNIIYHSAYGYEFFNAQDGSSTNNITLDHNTFIKTGTGWASTQTGWGFNAGRILRLAETTTDNHNFTITNNIFYDSDYRTVKKSTTWQGDEPILDYNLYYKSGNLIDWGATTYADLATFVTATDLEVNGYENINGSVFTNLTNGDYKPLIGSIACSMSSTGSYVGALSCADAPSSSGVVFTFVLRSDVRFKVVGNARILVK